MNRGKQLLNICERDAEHLAVSECWVSFERDGAGVRRVTVWDSDPGPAAEEGNARRAVVLFGGVDLSGHDVVTITTDSTTVANFLR